MTLPLNKIVEDVGHEQVRKWQHEAETKYKPHLAMTRNDFVHSYILTKYNLMRESLSWVNQGGE